MNFINTLDSLLDWKNLPAYKAEPRVDFIVAGALPEIIRHKFNEEIDLIIPEFPIRIGSIYPDKNINRSFKLDFYLLLKSGRNIFIEFKTDSGSRREKQDKYLKASEKVGLKVLMDGVIKIYNATTYKKKYLYLIEKLISKSLLSVVDNKITETVKNELIEIVYIQPQSKNENEIGFDEISELMKKSDDKLYQHFGEILKSWSDN